MSRTPERQARAHIDDMLDEAGWAVQDLDRYDPGVPEEGIAIREFPFDSGPADYLLVVGGEAVGVLEAKPEGTTLGGVAEQSQKYATSAPKQIPKAQEPLPFVYESTGVETKFRDLRDPHPRSRPVFHFHRPETLAEWIGQSGTLRGRCDRCRRCHVGHAARLPVRGHRGAGRVARWKPPAVAHPDGHGRGKTFMAVTQSYRLLKHAKAHRILFLVDRKNLGRQTGKEFQQYEISGDRQQVHGGI